MYPNLHSTMYLFQLTVIVHCSFSSCIYIPLCIYFNRRNCCINSAFISIYIPLCIYFNDSGHSGGGGSSRFTFHYVSISTFAFLIWSSVYTNLHSTMYLFQRPKCPGDVVMVCKFTFHYVSISTLNTAKPAPKVKIFTFHYVSISTNIFVRVFFSIFLFTFHYVSISTAVDTEDFINKILFTFHYVSISTRIRNNICRNSLIYIPQIGKAFKTKHQKYMPE